MPFRVRRNKVVAEELISVGVNCGCMHKGEDFAEDPFWW